MMAQSPQLGFFGKIASRGDFVSRNLDAGLRATLEEWLDRSLSESRRNLGDEWLDLYLTAPLWRFIMARGLCGDDPVAGVLMPSVDKVGRYYPLALVTPLPACHAPSRLFRSANQWFQGLERLALSTLEDGVDLEAFEVAVTAHGIPEYERQDEQAATPTSMAITPGAGIDRAYTVILDKLFSGEHADFSLWWTSGSDRVEASLLFSPGIPEPVKFCALLDGRWNKWNWRIAKPIAAEALSPPDALEKRTPEAIQGRGEGRSHVGTTREQNQDAWLSDDLRQVYCVADGAGGHAEGDFASRAVIEAIASVPAHLGFQDKLKAVLRAVQSAHDRCLRRASTLGPDTLVASTLAVLVLDSDRYALVWAGDSRIYHLRDETLTCITADHSDAQGYLTKAVGWGEWLEPDVRLGSIRHGDRFLLVTDGISKMLPIDEICTLVQEGSPEHVLRALLESALIAGATDNITAVVIDTAEALPKPEEARRDWETVT
jgi:type VI secretion system protein ImpM